MRRKLSALALVVFLFGLLAWPATPTRSNMEYRTLLPLIATQGTRSPAWRRDYSGGLVPKVASELGSWTTAGSVTWSSSGYVNLNDTDGNAESMLYAFTPPADNWYMEADVKFAGAANTLDIILQSAGGAADLFTLTLNGATGAMSVGAEAVTPADYVATEWVRIVFVVRPDTTDILVNAFYRNVDWYHMRLAQADTTKVWAYAGTIAQLKFATGAAGTGAVYVRNVSVKPLLGVVIGDSIATGHDSAANDKGYDPAPYYTLGRSGYSHNMSFWLEEYISPAHTSGFLIQGTGGDSLQDVIDRLTDFVLDPLAGHDDPLVILHAGTNIQGDTATDGSQALAKLDTILTALAGKKVIFGDIIPRDAYTADQNLRRAGFNAGLPARETATMKAALYSTNCTQIYAAGDPNTLNPELSGDGTHVIWQGYRYMGTTELIRVYKTLP